MAAVGYYNLGHHVKTKYCSFLVLVAIYVPMAAVGYYNLGHQVKTNIVDSVCNGTVSSNSTFFAQQFTRELNNLLLRKEEYSQWLKNKYHFFYPATWNLLYKKGFLTLYLHVKKMIGLCAPQIRLFLNVKRPKKLFWSQKTNTKFKSWATPQINVP
jgi:hypothetical protein